MMKSNFIHKTLLVVAISCASMVMAEEIVFPETAAFPESEPISIEESMRYALGDCVNSINLSKCVDNVNSKYAPKIAHAKRLREQTEYLTKHSQVIEVDGLTCLVFFFGNRKTPDSMSCDWGTYNKEKNL